MKDLTGSVNRTKTGFETKESSFGKKLMIFFKIEIRFAS